MLEHSNILSHRMRPEMVVGDRGVRGLHQLVHLLLDGVYSDARRGACRDFTLEVGADGALCLCSTGRSASPAELAEVVLGRVGQKMFQWMDWDRDSMIHDWGWSVSLPTALALSSRYELDSWDGARQWRLSGVDGHPMGKPREVQPAESPPIASEKGLRIRLVPDATLFETTVFDAEKLSRRCRELAVFAPGVRALFTDHRTGESTRLHYAGGLTERLLELTADVPRRHPEPLAFEVEWEGIRVRCALQWCEAEGDVWSYANTMRTHGDGVHVDGVLLALREALSVLTGEQVRAFSQASLGRGLRAIIAVDGSEDRMALEASTRRLLAIDDLGESLNDPLRPRMVKALREHPLLPWLVEHARARPRPAVVSRRRPRE